MVRNYKKKKQPKYDQDSLLLAMETVIKEGKSIRSVAKDFNIPFQTLRKHVFLILTWSVEVKSRLFSQRLRKIILLMP